MMAANVTTGFRWAPETQPNIWMINMTTIPKVSDDCNADGGWPFHDKQPMQPRNINNAVPRSSLRNIANASARCLDIFSPSECWFLLAGWICELGTIFFLLTGSPGSKLKEELVFRSTNESEIRYSEINCNTRIRLVIICVMCAWTSLYLMWIFVYTY